jgi:tetratricopeptide (TPR) repeat protein
MGANFSVMYLLGRAAKLAGNAFLAEEALNEASALIARSIEGEPESPEGHFLRGEVSFVQERYAAAIGHYRAAEDRAEPSRSYSAFGEDFSRVDVMVKRALCCQRMGNTDEAREVARQVLAIQPDHKLAKSLSQL